MIQLKNITKEYKLKTKKQKIQAVKNIDLEIKSGESVAYIGTNGSGKSTTIKMLTGILKPTIGDIQVMGLIPYKNRKKLAQNIGVVFGQRIQLLWDLPPIDSFNLAAKIYKISKYEYEQRLKFILSNINIEGYINQPVRKLSLGQRMCCEIILSLIHNPKILFLDEPTIGLDIFNKEAIRDFISTINKKLNTTIFLTSHDLDDVEKICNRIILIDQGEKIYDGEIQSLKKQFSNNKRVVFQLNSTPLILEELSNEINISVIYNTNSIEITYLSTEIKIKDLIDIVSEVNTDIYDISIENISLENIIKKISKKE